MTDDLPERAERAFATHDAYDRTEDGFDLTTTRFGGHVMVSAGADELAYALSVDVPTLSAAVADETVGGAVEQGWFETFARRLEDAPSVTRASVDLTDLTIERDGETVRARFTFSVGSVDRAPDVAKAFAEYVEGTYVEGVVPGYEYTGAVAALLGEAAGTGADGERGGTPL